ncbi:prolipoprotein diacylglyceryl transferase [Mangrovimonas sp. AS39]|uniref:prolipoprotein diacylglyceryl transferase family protein n=1 Tax=Mangrovimonas futianensis TaxID=2895523 RepID=UPI001E616C33|nr:prolipoprotein diacylglyceryl transferase family protein [Mangrovimonas futianensis]MCF1191743.1 prolipoprotein diacylglyceryl transferase [Mangrovimonas futianensis]MCF1195369.1 prolipoprotein diacylglyceryl transferase [Mangrovimonas futianensis]
MEVSIGNPQLFFKASYLIAFGFLFGVVVYKSLKQGYRMRSILLILSIVSLFAITGSRLFTIPVSDWLDALTTSSQQFSNRSAVGGLLFGLLGLLIAQRLLGFNKSILNLYAWGAPMALGIVKLGCFFNGCCYGQLYSGFGSVQYPKGTQAHLHHWYSGLIDVESLISASVHPVQIYDSLFLFFIAFLVYKSQKYWKKNASSLLFSVGLFFLMRFGIEFLRDPNSSQFNTWHVFGMRMFHWSMLMYGVLVVLILLWYEKRRSLEWFPERKNALSFQNEFMVTILISMIIYTVKDLFTGYELIVVWMKFIPVVILLVYSLFTEVQLKEYRWITSIFLIAPFVVFAQTLPKDTIKTTKYHRFDVGGSFGNYINEVMFDPHQGTCGTTYNYEYYKQVYQVFGLGYSQVVTKKKTTYTVGANVSGGNIKSTRLRTNESRSDFVYAINPYFKIDGKWIGVGGGIQVGSLRINKDLTVDSGSIEDADKDYNITPEFYFRVGPRKYFDADFNYGFLIPSPYPTLYMRSSVGSAFGLSEDYSLRGGYIWNLETPYISAKALVSDHFGVEVMYIFKENNFEILDNKASGKFVFSVNYRFGQSEK